MADDEEFVDFEMECARRMVAGTIARDDSQGRFVEEYTWFEGDPPPVIGPDGEIVVETRRVERESFPRPVKVPCAS